MKTAPRKDDALRRLGVKPGDLQAAPQITGLLKSAKGSLKAVLEAMRFSTDLSVIGFLEKYDSISERDRKSLSWEAIALAANVDPTHVLGGAILAIQAHSSNAVKIIALSNHPALMAKRVEYGMLPSGEKDRAAIDTALGFLPTAKGQTLIINPQARPAARGDDDEDDDDVADTPQERDLDHLFPSLTHTQEALVPPKARMLEGGK